MPAAPNTAALSPKSANVVVKPKAREAERKAPKAARMDSTQSYLPSPPPAIVTEPGDEQEQYVTGAYLGKGGFAICYQGTLKRNSQIFAMKVVKSDMKKKMQDKVYIPFHLYMIDELGHSVDYTICSFNRNSKSTRR